MSSEKMLIYAMQAYAVDWDDRLPARPWPEVFWSERCPDDRDRAVPSYAVHRRWLTEPLHEASNLIMIYESTPEPIAYRHWHGMNVGFTDGHVAWYPRIMLTPELIERGLAPVPPPQP